MMGLRLSALLSPLRSRRSALTARPAPSAPRALRAVLIAWGMVLGMALAGCSAPKPAQYAADRPVLDPATYFNGRLDAWGMFQDRFGNVVKRFTVEMNCRWEGDTGTLEEDFLYADGTRERRVWTLRRVAPDRYIGTASDVVGEAQGQVAGNAFNWRYTLALPIDGRTWHVDFDDWMFLIDDRVMLNRAVMSKFGIRLGEVTLSFTKR
mgnify:FL=1